MNLLCLQHVEFEGPAAIYEWANSRGHGLEILRMNSGGTMPALKEWDGLIVLGGPMSVHDESTIPWMHIEKDFLRQAVSAGKRVLGICLGAQLLAEVLGGEVRRAPSREIGWFPITWTKEALRSPLVAGFPPTILAFHWHGEMFSIPKDAVALASSAACPHQGFWYPPHVLALQFHLEATTESIRSLLHHCPHDLVAGPWCQTADEMEAGLHYCEIANSYLFALLDRFFAKNH
ncbi:MAG: type 1 glutamine amidotransferase [Candidatus Sumerlaea chitinivorans]|jgi:GMP synthase-like glutamine amidotransferase|nr:type 1 glutamine amidotransferase [Candidatus Sumerlaea chitinivorans]